jgi:hypothetical protein
MRGLFYQINIWTRTPLESLLNMENIQMRGPMLNKIVREHVFDDPSAPGGGIQRNLT